MENQITPQSVLLGSADDVPNNPDLPVLVYRGVLGKRTAEKDVLFQQHFMKSGWQGVWKNGIYDYHHFHTGSHEALGIASGSVMVRIGGENGKNLNLEAGDMIVLPAGTGHKKVSGSENLVVIGAYPAGQEDYNLCRSLGECENTEEKIAAVPLPVTDPFYGTGGPLLNIWRGKSQPG
jgi:uncharacterized protein YjlB